jgi:hypothetical protein
LALLVRLGQQTQAAAAAVAVMVAVALVLVALAVAELFMSGLRFSYGTFCKS